jgi:hypothetical protein
MGAVGTDGGVPASDACAFGVVLQGDLLQIDLAKDLPVGGWNLVKGFRYAGTEVCGSQVGSCGRRLDAGLPGLKGACLDRLVTVMVDNCIAEDAKEPCICGPANFEGIGVGDRFEVCHLQNVFGGVAVVDSALNEA